MSWKRKGTPDGLLAQLARLPEGRDFGTVQDVWEALTYSETDAPRS